MGKPIIIAIICLLAGAALYFWQMKRESRHFYEIRILSWLLIAPFPVLIIFSIFPESSIDIKLRKVSIGGAFAAFCFVWYMGSRYAIKGFNVGNLQSKINELEARISELTKADKQLPPSQIYKYEIASTDKQIGLITGGIEDAQVADIWVNSENTNMQMARFYDGSISGTIRYYGTRRDKKGNVLKDYIAEELADKMDEQRSVEPGIVLCTGAGELGKSNNVKRIFHAASVQGEVGRGYVPIKNIEKCVSNSLKMADGDELRGEGLSSILFPLFGTGAAKGELPAIAEKLIRTAIIYFEHNKNSTIKYVYFLMWSEKQLSICRNILDKFDNLNYIS